MFGDEGYGRYHTPTGWRRNGVIGITATVLITGGLLLAAATTNGADAATVGSSAREYTNCTALVTNVTKSNAFYAANKKSNRDGVRIACEKH